MATAALGGGAVERRVRQDQCRWDDTQYWDGQEELGKNIKMVSCSRMVRIGYMSMRIARVRMDSIPTGWWELGRQGLEPFLSREYTRTPDVRMINMKMITFTITGVE